MQFGVMASGQMPEALPDPGIFRDIAACAEDLRYDSLWCGDHLSFGNPILEGSIALSAFASYTTSITIGTGVLLLPLRPPGLVAKQMASLDYLTGGRIVCGVGVGGESAKDFELVGIPRSERGVRTDEGIEVMRALWTDPEASFNGRFTRFDDVGINPMPVRLGGPPIWVGGRADAALRRAGRLGDGWMGYMVSPDRFETSIARVRTHARDAQRDADGVAAALMIPTRLADDGDEARRDLAGHLTQRYHREFTHELISKLCLAGSPAEVAARVSEYERSGVRHLIFLYGGDPAQAIDQFKRLHDAVVSPRNIESV